SVRGVCARGPSGRAGMGGVVPDQHALTMAAAAAAQPAGRVSAGRSPRAGECRPRAGDIHRDGLHAHRWRAVHPPVADAGAGRERRVWSLADRLLDARGGATPAFQIDRFTIRTLCLSTGPRRGKDFAFLRRLLRGGMPEGAGEWGWT